MVRHFVRLKLRLLANRLRSQSALGTIAYLAIWGAGILAGVLGGIAVLGFGRLLEEPDVVLILAYTVVFFGWMVIPPSVSALDETLDPRRFELLPVSPTRLTIGLLAAGAVTPGGVGTLIGLVIASFPFYPDWSLAPLVTLVVIIELALCLLVARLVTTFLSNLLSSRRTRELVTLLIGVVIGVVALLPAFIGADNPEGSPDIEISVTSVEWIDRLTWLPPGALAAAPARWADGELPAALALTSYGMVATILIGAAWALSIRKMLVTAPIAGRRVRRRELERTLAIMPPWLRLPAGPVTGVVAKELRYLVRDNRVRSQLIGSVVPIVVLGLVSRGGFSGSPYTPFLAAGVSFLIVLGILANQFGFDGGSFWAYVVSSAPLASIVRGKNLAWGLVAGPPTLVAAVILAIWGDNFTYVAAAVLGAGSVLMVAIAIGNLTSIYGAFRISESNPFGKRGASGNAFVAVILSMMASGALVLPVAAVIGLPAALFGPLAATVGSVLSIGYGVLVYRLGMKVTSRLLVERQQWMLDAIDGERI